MYHYTSTRKHARPKDRSVRYHFKDRVYERYHIQITNSDIDDILYQIQHKKSEFMMRQSLTRVIHRVIVQGIKMDVVYNPDKKLLHTVLPEGWEKGQYVARRENGISSYTGVEYQ